MSHKLFSRLFVFWSMLFVVCFAFAPNQAFATTHHTLGRQAHVVSQGGNAQTVSCVNNTGDDCPAWWSNTPCDSINHKNATGLDSTILFNPKTGKKAIYDGIEACGPLPRIIGRSHDYNVSFYQGGPQEREWECTELVKRYLYEVFHLPNLGNTNGSQIVGAYFAAYPSVLKAINNGTHGVFPQPGDVLSYGNPKITAGHTSIVTGLTITNKTLGNGSITIIDENGSSTGMATHQIKNWVVNGTNDGGTITSWLTPRKWSNNSTSPNPGTYNYLYADTSTSSSDVWAVGYYNNGSNYPLATHWNGSSWGSNAISGNADTYLFGVSAISSSNVLAVGAYNNGSTSSTVAFYHTTSWATVPSDNPGISPGFATVNTDSSGDAWAVGTTNSSGDIHIVIEQYEGLSTGFQNWTLTGLDSTHMAVIPNLPGTTQNVLNAVTVYSSTDAWAVGRYLDSSGNQQPLIYHYNGTDWTNETAPVPSGSVQASLAGITELSANNVWAVGTSYNPYGQTYIIHWDGFSWRIVPSPNPSLSIANSLVAVSVIPGNQNGYVVYAVGETINSSGMAQTLVLVYASSTLCPSSGSLSCNSQWIQETSPNVGSANNNQLYGVTIISSGTDPGEAWAVGWYGSGSQSTLTNQLS